MKAKVDASHSPQRDPLQILRDLVTDEFECAICLHTCTDTNVNPQCGHRFCKLCIKESLTSCNRECPICRARIPTYRTLRQDAQFDRILLKVLEIIAVLEANITENEMSTTNSSKEVSDESQESCGKNTKCAVSSNRHDMDSSMGGKREAAAGGGMVAVNNHQVDANATMQKEKSSATKMKTRLNYHSNIIIRKRKVSEYSTLSTQEKASKSKRKKVRCQAEDEIANKDTKQNEKMKRKEERKASDSHPAVAVGIDVSDLIHHEANMDDGTDMHTMNAREKSNHEKWIRLFMELVEYKEQNEHCSCPTKNTTLGRWIDRQRTLFRSKELKEDRYEKLVGIGFVFEDASLASNNIKWNKFFMELVEYQEKNGHCNFPTTNGGSFVSWISYQRVLFRSKKLKKDRYEKLVKIGFVFEDASLASENVKWNRRFMELEKYKEKNGHCNCPTKNNGSLGIWIATQRFRSKKLNADRYEKLVGIGFAFEDVNFANSKTKSEREN